MFETNFSVHSKIFRGTKNWGCVTAPECHQGHGLVWRYRHLDVICPPPQSM